MFKKFYDKSIELASNKRSNLYLGVVSFVESSFFPIPPDVMVVPMVLAKKDSYIRIFLIATVMCSHSSSEILFASLLGSMCARNKLSEA